jgi:hypothetical protein
MKTAFKLTLLALVCVGMSSEAHAQNNLHAVPATPAAGQPFQVVFDDTESEEFVLSFPGAPPSVTGAGQQGDFRRRSHRGARLQLTCCDVQHHCACTGGHL